MHEQKLLDRFGATKLERWLSLVIFLAVTAGFAASLLDQPRRIFMIAWSVAAVSAVSWNVLVFLRQRREDKPNRSAPW